MPFRRHLPIRWQLGAGIDAGRWAMVGQRFVGQVVRYDEPPGWAGHVHAVPHRGAVPGGPWVTVEEAEAAFEAWWAQLTS